jgi:hypothetical protein
VGEKQKQLIRIVKMVNTRGNTFQITPRKSVNNHAALRNTEGKTKSP